MSGRCLVRSLRFQVTQTVIQPSTIFSAHPYRRSSAVTISSVPEIYSVNFSSSSTPLSASSFSVDRYHDLRLVNLEDTIESRAGPSQVWAAYTSLVSIAGSDFIPLQLHQQVLRLCCPSTNALRRTVTRRMQEGTLPEVSDIHENRFFTVFQNIRSIGSHPELADFDFVLGQFATVGHYEGCWDIYGQLTQLGYTPSQTTYGYCFQSIAHRFSLPIPKASRETIVTITQDMFSKYMADMRKFKIPMNPVTFDLSIRILKETLNIECFENLMGWGYGIDLSNPDRMALQFLDLLKVKQDGAKPVPFPFTTSALNTTIDVLGRLGNIPKMIQAFEVLTQPLPNAHEHFFNSFESDEDEDDFGVKVEVGPSTRFPAPYATPNTTTFKIMLRYVCRANHAVLARHYLNYARMLDRVTSHELRNTVLHHRNKNKPFVDIPSPRININAGMLLPLLGEGNKDKNLGLLKWLDSKMPTYIRKCQNDLTFYSNLLEEIKQESSGEESHPLLSKPSLPPVLDLDIENPPSPEQPSQKPFNINLHVAILERNYRELSEFNKRLDFIVKRTHERVKERLGRRVWEGKDVFFRDNRVRTPVSKEKWKEVVNFSQGIDSSRYKAKRWPWKPSQIDRPQGRRMSSLSSGTCMGFPQLILPTTLCSDKLQNGS